ncbi:hypothetical protein EMIT0P44_210029 [Pseudomonas sp. IT-P44]
MSATWSATATTPRSFPPSSRWARHWVCGLSPKGWKPTCSRISSPSWAAIRCRVTCWGTRCRRSASWSTSFERSVRPRYRLPPSHSPCRSRLAGDGPRESYVDVAGAIAGKPAPTEDRVVQIVQARHKTL